MIYADNAATTRLSATALAAMLPYLTEQYGNPSSLYTLGQTAATALAQARETVARCLHCRPEEIVFTSGGSEADNQAILSAARWGDRIAMIFQDPMTSLNPVYPVGRQVAEVLRLHRGLDRKAAKARTVDLFHQVGIPDPAARYGAYPRQLSGGLRQRVMIAMAMACEPELLIADEPTTALDATIQAQILRLMGDLRRDHGTAILLITHNMGVVAQLCDYVYVMYAGQIVEAAETFDLFRTPRHPYTAGLLRAIPSLEGAQERLYTIPGTVPAPGAPHPGCRFCPRCDQGEGDCAASPPPLTHLGGGHLVRCHHPR